MNLKEAILQRDKIWFVDLLVEEMWNRKITCNINKNEFGTYMYDNPELTIDNLAGIEFTDIASFDFCEHDYDSNNFTVTISEKIIRKNKGKNKVYDDLNKLLDKEYKDYIEYYSKLEKEHKGSIPVIFGTLGFILIFSFLLLPIQANKEDMFMWKFSTVVLIIGCSIIGIMISKDRKKDYQRYKELKEEYELKLANNFVY